MASSAGGLGEAVADGRTGLLVPPEDPVALQRAIARLLRDPELRARLAAAGPQRVDEHFRADRMVDDYENLYFEVLEEVERP